MGKPEKRVERAVERLLAAVRPCHKIYSLRQPHRASITPGVPDLLIFTDREGLIFMEIKAGADTLTDAQLDFRHRCKEAGVRHVVGTEEDLAEELGGVEL